MFTTWQQVEDWIRDNAFDHWLFTKTRPQDEDKATQKIVDSDYYSGDFEDKVAMTKKYLEMNGGRAYGVGYKKPNIIKGGTYCEVCLEQLPASGIGMAQQVASATIDADALRKQIRAEMEAEWDKREYKRLREELDKERKEFNAEKNSAIGLLTNYLAPVAKGLLERRRVAGLDADEDVHAPRIVPTNQPQEQQEPEQNEIFSDEESDKLFELMARFKKVEPDYLTMIEKVVAMAESGANAYTMAKDFLMKL